MTKPIIESIAKAGEVKALTSKKDPRTYFLLAIIAGIFIFVGGIFSIISAAWFYTENLGLSKLLGASTFATALTLIVLLGGELFTGCNFVMGVSTFEKKTSMKDSIRVWVMAYVGNFVGIMVFCALFAASAVNHELIAGYLLAVIPGKLSLPWYTLIVKGILCNFLVCLGVYAGFKAESEFGKITMIIMVITTFVLGSMEHSIANMVFFGLDVFLNPAANIAGMGYNLFFVTIGNIIGGAVALGVPMWLAAQRKPIT